MGSGTEHGMGSGMEHGVGSGGFNYILRFTKVWSVNPPLQVPLRFTKVWSVNPPLQVPLRFTKVWSVNPPLQVSFPFYQGLIGEPALTSTRSFPICTLHGAESKNIRAISHR